MVRSSVPHVLTESCHNSSLSVAKFWNAYNVASTIIIILLFYPSIARERCAELWFKDRAVVAESTVL